MTCKHSIIQTYVYVDNNEPGMWACAECKHKFFPFSQMMQEVEKEREACAELCGELAMSSLGNAEIDTAQMLAAAIRARRQE